MGELSLSLFSIPARRAVAVALIGISALAVVLSLGVVGASAQVPGECFADRDAIAAFVAKAPDSENRFKCTDGKATALNLDGYTYANDEVPAEIGGLTNLTRLNLDDAFIRRLPPEIGKLTNLTYLSFYENQITELPSEIGKLTKLTYLNPSENPLTKLPPEVANLTNLTKLNLSYSAYTTVPPEVAKLTKLNELNLFGNNITTLPPEIGNLTELTQLYLSKADLRSLPAEIGKLTKLTMLRVTDTNLTTLPTQIANLANLQSLDLRDNDLASLPPEVWGLTSLTSLDVSGNGLSSVPPQIGDLRELTMLDLRNNALTALPPEIGNLNKLVNLDVASNALTSLPAEIGDLSELDRLYISGNKLTTLPATIGGLKNVTWLVASFNELTSVPPQIGALAQVKHLYLDYNQLRSLPAEIANLPNLSELAIGHNQLESLPVELGELTKRLPSFTFAYSSQYQDSGLTFPYVAIGSCASGSPALIAMAPQYSGSQDTQTITVDGTTYPLAQHRSRLSTATLSGAGTGPSFAVNFAGQTQTITCQKPAGSSGTVGDTTLDREVSIARSCLAGNGRIDFNIVNSESDARYRIEFQGLSARERTVTATEAWRMPFTGRKDGTYTVKVTKTLLADDTTQAITRDLAVDCTTRSPKELSQEVEVIPYCVAGSGFIRYQFVNPTDAARSYIIAVDGLTNNRSTTARAFGASISGVSGRPDGTYKTTVEYGDQRGAPIHSQSVTINCANP